MPPSAVPWSSHTARTVGATGAKTAATTATTSAMTGKMTATTAATASSTNRQDQHGKGHGSALARDHDYQAFVEAIRSGRLAAMEGV